MNEKPTLILDTSVYNSLADDCDSPALISALRSSYAVRLTALNISEVLANSDDRRRSQLSGLCRLFLVDGGCLMPHHWIVEKMIRSHDPVRSFDWMSVDVQFPAEITEGALFDGSLAKEEREHLRRAEEELFGHLDQLKEKFKNLFLAGTQRPRDYAEFLSILCPPGGAFWKLAKGMYERVTGFSPTEELARNFIVACPPFHAALLGIFVAYYERCIRDLKTGPSLRAGRYDLFMSVYLPLCTQFISNDDRQIAALREIVVAGGFRTEVLSYRQWRASH